MDLFGHIETPFLPLSCMQVRAQTHRAFMACDHPASHIVCAHPGSRSYATCETACADVPISAPDLQSNEGSIESALMSEQPGFPPDRQSPGGQLFNEPSPERGAFPTTPAILAAVAVIVLIAVFVVVGRHGKSGAGQANAAYASSLEISNIQVSQSQSLSGGRSTYLDGHIANRGNQTVTGITLQATFATDSGQPQVLTAPVAVIRTREPYVDTQPLSMAPLPPGGQADFRLIFEGVTDAWDQKPPTLAALQVSTR